MKERIPLQIIDKKLILTCVVSCRKLRVQRQIMKFVIDTGSTESLLSNSDVKKLQIPIKGKQGSGVIDFGGSRFNKIDLPRFSIFILKEDKERNSYIELKLTLSALKTTKKSAKNIQIADILPSILGMDFLEEQKMSLHVIPTEKMAFLQLE